MSSGPISTLERIFKPVLNPIFVRVLKPLREAQKLPLILIKKFQAILKGLLSARETSLKNYILIGSYYISKRLLLFIALGIIVLVYFLFIRPPVFVNKWFNRVPVLTENTPKISTYSGQAKVVNDQKSSRYVGDLVDGLYAGKGKLYSTSGSLEYEGDFDKGQKSGVGTLFDEKGGLLYKGQFSADAWNGPGTLYYAGQKVQYIGEFQNGKFGGAGKLYSQTGEIVYEGVFSAGSYNGAGKLFFPTGTVLYEGEFATGEYNGAGKLFDDKGLLIYEGGFKNNKYSGSGTEYYANGFIKYVGQFLAGAYNGEGSSFNDKGILKLKGAFQNGIPNGPGEAYDEAGKLLYKGEFLAGKYEGLGTLFDKDGAPVLKSFFAGGFVNLQGFIGLSSKKVADLLGEAAEVTLVDSSVLLAGQEPVLPPAPEETETGADGGTAIGGIDNAEPAAANVAAGPDANVKLLLNYPDLQLSLLVEPSAANPKEAVVTSLSVWGSKPLSMLQPSIETFKDRLQPNDEGYRILELNVQGGAGTITNSYFKGDYLFTFTRFTNETLAHMLQVSSIKPNP